MKIYRFLLLVFASMLLACGQASNKQESTAYYCSPCGGSCDTIKHDKPGICEHCNMLLVSENELANQQMTIAFYLQDGVEVLDFAGPMEVFAYAGFKVFTVSKTKDPIVSQGILKVMPDYSINDAPEADVLAFFGGNSSAASGDKAVIDWVKKQQDIQYYFSVCTGAFVLGEAGILEGKTATTFHNALQSLRQSFPNTTVVDNARFVDNGNAITTAGISAGIDGALHLVARLKGLPAAQQAAYYMEYDKWKPGEGLLLTPDNLYSHIISEKELLLFSGEYEYMEGKKMTLAVDTSPNTLSATIDGKAYPIYHHKDLTFLSRNNDVIQFEKGKDDTIQGYYLPNDDKLYKKIN